jgi:hypothetical protein
MSNVALSSNPLGTGTFTIASPNSNTNRTLTLPDATGTFITANGSNQLVAPASGILFADATTQTTAASVTTTTVLAATASASVGAVGTYAFLRNTTQAEAVAGSTLSGASLAYTNANGVQSGGPSGTWRIFGYNPANTTGSTLSSLWLRIS